VNGVVWLDKPHPAGGVELPLSGSKICREKMQSRSWWVDRYHGYDPVLFYWSQQKEQELEGQTGRRWIGVVEVFAICA